jgi:hypothetical protein
MSKTPRATVLIDPDLHKALRIKAAQTDQTLSEIVNSAIRTTLADDAANWPVVRPKAKAAPSPARHR